ncbi:MAG: TonB-dependent receptor, partial [candidate division KSB1 bacterium]|nr:TonB-dependent receptor [candidate division KSB1 bacterium]
MAIRTILCIFLLNSVILAQQTTGNLIGEIVDEDDAPIPYVNIVASGDNPQGTRGAATDEFGFFRILALQVGSYSIRIEHIAKRPVIIEPVIIRLGKTTTLGEVTLAERTLETDEILVTAKRPLIDPLSTATGANLTLKTIEQLPVQRDHRSVATLVPQANISYLNDDINIAGSTGLENLYFIDGMNTTDPNFGRTSTYLPYNFVKEVEVKTGGYEPEYRSALGGVVNVITPSGGNEFTGQAFCFFTNDAMRAEPRLGFIEYDIDNFRKNDFGLSIGGPIVRDKLWFHSAYSYVVENKSIGITDFGMQDDTFQRHVFAGKLT